MREIKFRAWDKENFIMHFSNENEDGIVWEIQPKIKFLELRTIDSFPGGEYHEQSEQWVEPEQILMQYTGLKDKNGKKIFEGDVLQLAKGDDGAIYACVVTFNNETGAFACRKIEEDKPYSDHMYGSHIGEVIGNIYENPELIK